MNEKGNELFLFQIFHEVQEDLHSSSLQLMEAKYNNKMEYIKFRRNEIPTSPTESMTVNALQLIQIESNSFNLREKITNVKGSDDLPEIALALHLSVNTE